MNEPQTRRILSGVQPTGKLHLGNYFGAIKQHIALQSEGMSFYFLADYHSMTTVQDAASAGNSLGKRRLTTLALGLDPAKAIFFRQSDVPEVCELAWILSTVINMGLLERAHSYKDKVEKGVEASVGLFTYPILMAADILIYRSHLVPVGQDQVQHVEMTRDIAEKFNRIYGEIFPLPNYRLESAAKVPGTDGQKMSKSYGNTIEIFAEGKALKKTVMSNIITDTAAGRAERPRKEHDFRPLQVVRRAGGAKCAGRALSGRRHGLRRSKNPAAREDRRVLQSVPREAQSLAADPSFAEEVLREGAKKARAEAVQTMELVRTAVGFAGRPV